MKKFFCVVCIVFSAAFFLNAEQDNGKLFPSREHYSIENIFYGFSGIFDFPNTFYNESPSAMTGVGGGFSAELGYNWSGWMLSAEYLYEAFATKNAAFVRLEKSRNNIFQLRIRRVLSNKTINKFPEWFSLVPGFGAGINLMQGDYYATQADKDLGNYNHINFNDKEGRSAIIRFSMEAAFDIFKHGEFIPFIGLDYNLIFNERLSGGISGYPRISLGFRRYPFNNQERLKRFKKLLDYDQIRVTEIPPREPHLNAIDDNSRVFNVYPGDDGDDERNANQMLLWDEDSDKMGDDSTSDDNTDNENEDVYNDDKDKKEDYYLPKDENDSDDKTDKDFADDKDDGKIPPAIEMPTLKISSSISDGFTPDGDGINDTIDFMLEATGLERQPKSWTVQIVDDAGNVVKSWKGTRKMPEKITWDGVTDNKKLVDAEKEYSVIVSVVPNARDAARTGVDTLTDTNSFRTGKMAGSSDNKDTPIVAVEMPALKVSPSISDGFTPDGDGINDTIDFMLEATGLERQPKSWTVQVVDDAGNVVKSWKGTRKMPEKITWDGITDSGELVDSEKEYSVIVSVVPNARDSARTGIDTVTDTNSFRTGKMAGMDDSGLDDDGINDQMPGTTEMPTLKVSSNISDRFTPDGDGIDDTVDFMFETTGLEYPPESWTVQVVDDAGNVVKTWSGYGDMPEKITWDGVTDSGEFVDSEKEYSVIISAVPDARDAARTGIDAVTDTNSFITGKMAGMDDSGLDGDGINDQMPDTTEMPTLKVSSNISDGFTPDGDGIDDTVDFMFETTGLEYPPESWTVQVVDDAGNVVKTWSGYGDMPEKITWDGVTDSGELVDSEKEYSVIISAVPDARDAARTGIGAVTDTNSFITGKMAGMDDSGDNADTPIVIVETPTLKVSSSISDGFTPDGDGIDDTVDFMFETTGLEYPPESWTVQIVDDAGNVVKSWSDTGDDVPEKITWNGVTDSGDLVHSDTDYNAIISVVPDARDKARTGIDTVTDADSFRTGSLNDIVLPVARLLMSYSDGLSPDGDGNKDTIEFTFKTSGMQYAPESWKLEIFDPADNIIRTWSGNGELPESITWDGTSDNGDIVAALSNYPVILSVTPDARDRGELETDTLVDRHVLRTGIITIDETDNQKEKLPEESLSPEGKEPVEEMVPETEEQPVDDSEIITPVSDEEPETKDDTTMPTDEQSADDESDTTAPVSDEESKTKDDTTMPTDEQPADDESKQNEPETEKQESPAEEAKEPVEEELEVKEGSEKEPEEKTEQITTRKRWRLISVPVYFDPDTATFNLISEENRQSNIRVLNKIAAEIRKYGDTATVVVEGHANNVSNTEKEHFEELIPLSLERAEVVRQLLIERGIEAERLTAEGVGGIQPQSPWSDRRNWWKNRRVEFIISVEE